MLVYLLELDYYDPATAATGTLCFSTSSYCSEPTDTPADQYYEPRLSVALNYQQRVFRDGLTPGCGEGGFGTASVIIPDGELDHLKSYVYDNRPARCLAGDDSWPRSAFKVLVEGQQATPEFHLSVMTVKLRDAVERFGNAVSRNVYLGNNVDGQGVEGDTDLMGKTKPVALGRCWNAPLVLVSEADDIYQFHDGQAHAVDAVMADGVPLTLLDAAADMAALKAATVAGGEVVPCPALGLVRAPGQASSDLTANVRGCALGGEYVSDLAGLIRRVATHYIRAPRTNLIRYSEALSNAAWAVTGGAVALDATVAFPGADVPVYRLTEDGSTGGHKLAQTLSAATGLYCWSVHLRPAGRSRALARIAHTATPANNVAAVFDLEALTVLDIQTNGDALGADYDVDGWLAEAWVVALPDGWVRVSVAGQPHAGAFAQLTASVELLDGASAASYAGNGASGVHVAAAQLELAATPARYTGPTASDPVTAFDPEEELTYDEDSFTALAAACPQEVGYFVAAGGTDTAASVCDALCGGLQAAWGITASGGLRVGLLRKVLAGETPALTFTPSEIKEDTLDWSAPFTSSDGAPPYRVILSGVRNWTVQKKSELASAVVEGSPAYARWVGEEYRDARREDPSILERHPAACTLTFVSQLAVLADVNAQAKALFELYTSGLDRFSFVVPLDLDSGAFDLDFLDVVRVVYPRFGLDDGRNFLVVGRTPQSELREMTIEVLG